MKKPISQKISTLLEAADLRRTKSRVSVLTVLLAARRPMTQDQIAESLGRSAPNKVTIYRILETFSGTGIIHKAFLHDRAWHFELGSNCTDTQCHPHFTCTSCGETHCMPQMSLPMPKTRQNGFIINRQQTRLEGLCPDCNPDI